MSATNPLIVGRCYNLIVRGARSSYVILAEVIEVTEEWADIRPKTGRTLRIPLEAIQKASLQPPEEGKALPIQAQVARKLLSALDTRDRDSITVVEAIIGTLREQRGQITSKVNDAKAGAILELADRVLAHLRVTEYLESAAHRRAVLNQIEAIRNLRSYKARQKTLPHALERILERLILVEEEHWSHYRDQPASPPQIVTRDRVNVTRGTDGEFDLPVRIYLDTNATPIRDVRLILDKFRNLKAIGTPSVSKQMRPGETVVLRTRMRDSRKQGSKSDVKIEAHLAYDDLAGDHRESPRQMLDLRIRGKETHEQIPNPFRAYAGGLPVESPVMFFGREGMISEFTNNFMKSSGGVCYALYGQQRTGKSSVLEQVKARLTEEGSVVASLSMGTIDRRSTTIDFIEEVLDQFRARIDTLLPAELSSPLFSRWPDASAIEKRPLRSLQRACEAARSIMRSAGYTAVPFVVVVDEFTYVYEVLRRKGIDPAEHNELRDFMRQLKGILESRLLSALLVGQDTMPRFLDAYPNEFSVMSTRKLDYLTSDETQALAEKPILVDDKYSRYSGYALTTIALYTDGHPFFTQILCDRVVTQVNEKRRTEITQSDVEEAVETLISGHDQIEAHKFDCLVTADNTHGLLSQMNDAEDADGSRYALEALNRIAVMSGSQNNPVPIDSLELDLHQKAALEDLRVRGVLRETDTGVAIRVLLYADYLRRRSLR